MSDRSAGRLIALAVIMLGAAVTAGVGGDRHVAGIATVNAVDMPQAPVPSFGK
jgi:hypothetical protein